MMMIDSAAVQAAMLRLGVGVTELAKIAEIPPKTISAIHRRDKSRTTSKSLECFAYGACEKGGGLDVVLDP